MSVYFYGCTTIDGYLADKNHSLDWLYQTGTVEDTGYLDFYNQMDITIMGRKTFDEIAKTDYASSAYPTTDNYVFTHAQNLPFKGFIPVAANIVTFISGIEKSKNIWIVGGNQLLAPLLNHDMVDEIIIQIAPVLLGRGIPLFTQQDILKRFSLENVCQYGQFAQMTYKKLN